MKYCGLVVDISWLKALYALSPIHRASILRSNKSDDKVSKGFDFIYGLNRQPRVFDDELI